MKLRGLLLPLRLLLLPVESLPVTGKVSDNEIE